MEREDELKTKRTEVQNELVDKRNRIDQLEAEAVEQSNTRRDDLLELLDFRNLERIWLERTESERRDGRRKATTTFFELCVVRTTAGGTSDEATVDHLSESEREVTGLAVTLAGYPIHDVYDILPFLL